MPKNKADQKVRSLRFERASIDLEARTVELSASSDIGGIVRYVPPFGYVEEVLVHIPGSVDDSRFSAELGGPLLYNHNVDGPLLGRFYSKSVEGGKWRGVARFGNSPEAEAAWKDVQDGILVDVSVRYDYEPSAVEVAARDANGKVTSVRVTEWMPLEVSMVTIPADASVGVGRSENFEQEEAPSASEADTDQAPATPAPEEATTEEVRYMDANTQAPQGPSNTMAEAMSLIAVAERQGIGTEAREMLADGKTVDQARQELFALLGTRAKPLTAPSLEEMGASKRELRSYSYANLLAQACLRAEGKAVSGMEVEISQDLAKNMPITYQGRGGLFIPFRLRAETIMDTKTAGAGKELVIPVGGELIEVLRSKIFAAKLGATVLSGLNSPVTFPKETSSAVAQWLGENSGAATGSHSGTGSVTLNPKTLIGTVKLSRQLLTTASVDVENMVRRDLASSHALAIDKAAVHGTGTTQPTGIYNLDGVNVLAMGGKPTFAKLVDMMTEVMASDASVGGNLGYVTTPQIAGLLMQTLEFSAAGSKAIWTGTYEDGMVNGCKAASSSLVSTKLGTETNEHGLVAGDWSQLVIGNFGAGLEIVPDFLTLADQALVKITSFGMADVICRHEESFTRASGVLQS